MFFYFYINVIDWLKMVDHQKNMEKFGILSPTRSQRKELNKKRKFGESDSDDDAHLEAVAKKKTTKKTVSSNESTKKLAAVIAQSKPEKVYHRF